MRLGLGKVVIWRKRVSFDSLNSSPGVCVYESDVYKDTHLC